MKYVKYILGFIVLIVLLFFGMGLIKPSVSYNSEIVVEKSAKESWAVMSDKENLPKWLNGYKRAELVSGEENTVGAVSNIYFEENGKEMMITETITQTELYKLMAMNFSMDFMDMEYEMQFNKQGDKTIIQTSSVVSGNNLFAKSMISFMGGSMQKQEDTNMGKLEELINNNTKDYFPKMDTSVVVIDSIQ